MRKAYSKQRRLDSVPIDQVELNLDCRDSIIPVLRALQHVYSDATLTEKVLDLNENHIKLRAIMGLGLWDAKTEFKWRRIRDNVCLLTPETIDRISQMIVAAGHEIVPAAVEKMRADSFVMPLFSF